MSEEPVFGARVIKCINCLEKEIEGELGPLAAVTLVFVTGFDPGDLNSLCRGRVGSSAAEGMKIEDIQSLNSAAQKVLSTRDGLWCPLDFLPLLGCPEV